MFLLTGSSSPRSIPEFLQNLDTSIMMRGFPSGSVVKNLPSNARNARDRLDPWVGAIRWSMRWQPIPVFLPGKYHGQRSLAGYSSWGHRVGLSWTTERTDHQCMGSRVCLMLCGCSRQACSQPERVHSHSWVKPSPMGSSRLHGGQDVRSTAWRRKNEFWGGASQSQSYQRN